MAEVGKALPREGVSTGGKPVGRSTWAPSDPLEAFTVRNRLAELGERPHVDVIAATPAVTKAWKAVETAIEQARAAAEEARTVDRDRKAEEAAYLAAVRSAASTGADFPDRPQPRDWQALAQAKQAYARGKLDAAAKARQDYDAAVAKVNASPDRANTLTEALTEAHAATLAALTEARERLADAEAAWQALMSAGSKAGLERQPRQHLNAHDVRRAIRDAEAGLAKLDPAAPIYADTRGTALDMQSRLAYSQSGSPVHRWELAALERSEGYRVSDLSRNFPPIPRPQGARDLAKGEA